GAQLMATAGPMTFARAGVGHALHEFLARYPRTLSERVLQQAGIGPKQLANADELISHRALVESLELAAAETNDPAFGLSVAASAAWQHIRPLAQVVFNSPTLGAGLSNACRYITVQQNAARPTIDLSDGSANLLYNVEVPGGTCHAQHSENVVGMVMRICR